MSILKDNEIVLFDTILSDNLVRIGTIPDGNCMFHSFSRGRFEVYNMTYNKLSIDDILSLDNYANIMKRAGVRNVFVEDETVIPTSSYYIDEDDNIIIVDEELYELGLKRFRNSFGQWLRIKVREYIRSDESNSFLRNTLPTLLSINGGLEEAKRALLEDLEGSKYVPYYILLILSSMYNVDTYLLNIDGTIYDSRTFKEVDTGETDIAVIIVQVDNIHFELIGEYIDDHLNTSFNQDNKLIELLYDNL